MLGTRTQSEVSFHSALSEAGSVVSAAVLCTPACWPMSFRTMGMLGSQTYATTSGFYVGSLNPKRVVLLTLLLPTKSPPGPILPFGVWKWLDKKTGRILCICSILPCPPPPLVS